jgi:hypothetical protein
MLWWICHEPAAQQTEKDLHYAPLPQQALTPIERTRSSLKCEGKAILSDM